MRLHLRTAIFPLILLVGGSYGEDQQLTAEQEAELRAAVEAEIRAPALAIRIAAALPTGKDPVADMAWIRNEIDYILQKLQGKIEIPDDLGLSQLHTILFGELREYQQELEMMLLPQPPDKMAAAAATVKARAAKELAIMELLLKKASASMEKALLEYQLANAYYHDARKHFTGYSVYPIGGGTIIVVPPDTAAGYASLLIASTHLTAAMTAVVDADGQLSAAVFAGENAAKDIRLLKAL